MDVSVDDECNIVVDSMSHKDYEIHFAVEFEKQKKTVRVYQKLEDLPSAPFVDNEQNITRVEFDDGESEKCIEMPVTNINITNAQVTADYGIEINESQRINISNVELHLPEGIPPFISEHAEQVSITDITVNGQKVTL